MDSPTISIALPCWGEGDRAPTVSSLMAAIDAAENAGFDRVVVSEHVVYGDDTSEDGDPARGGTGGGGGATGAPAARARRQGAGGGVGATQRAPTGSGWSR